MTIKAGIVGATGYTGEELLRLLSRHPEVQITLATSTSQPGEKVSEIFPDLKTLDLIFETLHDETIGEKCSVLFSCLPHSESMQHVPNWLRQGIKVIDLSADFRYRTPQAYEKSYGRHTSPDLLAKAVYGLPEIYREKIKKASLIGNPGCYPTSALLGLIPLLKNKMISEEGIIIDSKSGMSGAGRSKVEGGLREDVQDSFYAYSLEKHRHASEIEQEISLIAGKEVSIRFTPHLLPIDRGILSTIYARPKWKCDTKKLLKTFQDFYKGEPFVQVLPEGKFPKIKETTKTNNIQIGAFYDDHSKLVVIITALDNLMKGASSQAVQNMNLICGFEETTGLI
ncbi:MAG: N-acetyl-gamma-glutamyl-phosphate reductase [Deltaproteobacteria bacterium]|nr:N-acetyl-gamma-glutamyl-phosphate reductase [Deltaproteobacteria bacterium]